MIHLLDWIFGFPSAVPIWLDVFITIGVIAIACTIVYFGTKYQARVEEREKERERKINKLFEIHKL